MNQISGAEPVIVPASCPVNGSSTFGESSTGDEKSVTVSKTAFDDGTFDGPDNGFGASLRSSDSFSEGERKNITFIDTSLPPRGSQSTAAYASPLQDDCRLRTSCDSIHDEGHWHADLDGFINEKDRAGGPYLCARPIKMTRPKGTDTLWEIFENLSLVKLILSTLDRYNTKAISMVIRNCEYKFERQLERMPTLLITATRDKFSDNWVKACREIWKHLSENEFGQVNVEIADPAVHSGRPFYAWTVQPQEPLYSVYSDIIAKIHDQVDFSEILSISGLRVGESPDEENSDPFIFVTVSHRSNQDWRCVRDQIVSILDKYNLPMVGVHILKSKMWGGTGGL
ncbi:hypothetical protein N7475_002532 [Penicillium sp. IBT 31633x]|nr:hypothetical protein N7475_002532 [Penicillium sp. IBT 31633x]